MGDRQVRVGRETTVSQFLTSPQSGPLLADAELAFLRAAGQPGCPVSLDRLAACATDPSVLEVLTGSRRVDVLLELIDNPNTPVRALIGMCSSTEPVVQRALCACERLPSASLEQFAGDWQLAQILAGNRTLEPQVLAGLLLDPDVDPLATGVRVLENPSVSPDVLVSFVEQTHPWFSGVLLPARAGTPLLSLLIQVLTATAVGNPSLPVQYVRGALSSAQAPVRLAALTNPSFPVDEILALRGPGRVEVDHALASRSDTPPEVLAEMWDAGADIVHQLRANPSTPASVLLDMCDPVRHPSLQWLPAEHQNIPQEAVDILLEAGDVGVLGILASNPNLTGHHMWQMLPMADYYTKVHLAERLDAPVALLEVLSNESLSDVVRVTCGNPAMPFSVLEVAGADTHLLPALLAQACLLADVPVSSRREVMTLACALIPQGRDIAHAVNASVRVLGV